MRNGSRQPTLKMKETTIKQSPRAMKVKEKVSEEREGKNGMRNRDRETMTEREGKKESKAKQRNTASPSNLLSCSRRNCLDNRSRTHTRGKKYLHSAMEIYEPWASRRQQVALISIKK